MKPAQALSVIAIVSFVSITSASTASAQQGQISTVPGLQPPSPSAQNGAEVIVESIPVLKIDEAVALAVKGNRQVQSAALGVDAAQQETAALRTSRLPQFKTYLLGGEACARSASFLQAPSASIRPLDRSPHKIRR
jgi:hypothetical protein